MRSTTQNLTISTLIVALGFGVTFYVFHLGTSGVPGQGPVVSPVARLVATKNAVRVLLQGKFIWQTVSDLEPLYTGEEIKTLDSSETKIIFKNGTEVFLDSGSDLKVKAVGKILHVDLGLGHFNVKGGKASPDENLFFFSGKNSIQLTEADAFFTNDVHQLEVLVSKGVAQIADGARKIALEKDKTAIITESSIEVTPNFVNVKSPATNEKVYVRLDRQELIRFGWEPLESLYEVRLFTGKNRDVLAPATDPMPGNLGELNFKLAPETIYWQLVAVNKNDPRQIYSSVVSKLNIISEVPPQLLYPINDLSVSAKVAKSSETVLRWTNPANLDRLHLEVSRDPKFLETVISEEVEDTGAYPLELKDEGRYFWRLSGFRPLSAISLTSQAHAFTVKLSPALAIPPPASTIKPEAASAQAPEAVPRLSEPVHGLSILEKKGIVDMRWIEVPGARAYLVSVKDGQGKSILLKKFFQNRAILKGVGPGLYTATVASINEFGKVGPSLPEKKFLVKKKTAKK